MCHEKGSHRITTTFIILMFLKEVLKDINLKINSNLLRNLYTFVLKLEKPTLTMFLWIVFLTTINCLPINVSGRYSGKLYFNVESIYSLF